MTSTQPALNADTRTQRWAYPLLLVMCGIALGVGAMPAPLYGIYMRQWHLSPLYTTIIFAVYAIAALAAVLVSGRISDATGRRPLLIGAILGMIVGLIVFLMATNMGMLIVARIIHGAAVGVIVVVSAAALLDLRPHNGARSGQLNGMAYDVGIAVTIMITAALAQYAPYPLRTPYAVAVAVCVIVGVGVLMLREPHTARVSGPIRFTRPSVPHEIRSDFWFSALGGIAAWSVLGVQVSLYPSLASQQAQVTNLLFAGGIVAVTAFSAAVVQYFATRLQPRRQAVMGFIGMAIALTVTVIVLQVHSPSLVFVAAALLGTTFGLAFGGSVRHLASVAPADKRGETMSAFYVIAYIAMSVPPLVAGWAATRWSSAEAFPWFAGFVGITCLVAATMGTRSNRRAARTTVTA